MSLLSLSLCAALAAAAPGELRVELHEVEGEWRVDAAGNAASPAALLRGIAHASGRGLRGDVLLEGAEPVEIRLEARPLDDVLDWLGLATLTRIQSDADVITVSPLSSGTAAEDLELEAETAWLGLMRAFPEHEAARLARLHLGRAQARKGNDDAALAHFDAATRKSDESAAADEALLAASELFAQRGDWRESMRRLSQLAQRVTEPAQQAAVRLRIARALCEQGRGDEALALLEAIDLSYPPRTEREGLDRLLPRARAHLALGDANAALRALDTRTRINPRLAAEREDVELRSRAMEALGFPLEAARGWLACAALTTGRDHADALLEAARLAARGGDDLGVLLLEGSARGTEREAQIVRIADQARARLRLVDATDEDPTFATLEQRWLERARLAPAARAALAARLITAADRELGIEPAAALYATALAELDGADAAPIRAALATAFEGRGAWADAARTWGGRTQ